MSSRKMSLMIAITISLILTSFSSFARRSPDKVQSLDQALQESIEQRMAATERFKARYTDAEKELSPLADRVDRQIFLGDKREQPDPLRAPSTQDDDQ